MRHNSHPIRLELQLVNTQVDLGLGSAEVGISLGIRVIPNLSD